MLHYYLKTNFDLNLKRKKRRKSAKISTPRARASMMFSQSHWFADPMISLVHTRLRRPPPPNPRAPRQQRLRLRPVQ